MNKEGITHVGLDAHKKSIQVAMLLPGREKPVEWGMANEPGAVRRMVKKVLREGGEGAEFCYEAGPCGYALQRQIRQLGATCQVIAPGLIPVKPGDRIKTDSRDARKLAELFRAGLLTEVHPPTLEEEAVRDLCRCREDAKADLLRSRHRLGKMLLRRGILWEGGKRAWTMSHMQWLRGIAFEHASDKAVFADYLLAIEQLGARLKGLDAQLEEAACKDPYRQPVGWLRCFRGIDTVTAMTIVSELHDFRRFQSPRDLMAYLGLVPSEHSSGEKRHQGSVTKAGNSHVRRVLVEAAWHYRHPVHIGAALQKRRQGQPGRAVAVADRAAQRLHQRFWKLSMRGKPAGKVILAVARELAGFIWAALTPPVAGALQRPSPRRTPGARAPLASAGV